MAIVVSFLIPQTLVSKSPKLLSDTQPVEIEYYYQKPAPCSCIKYVRNQGIDIPLLGEDGTPKDLIPNSTPSIGNLILLKYKEIYHVAIIIGYTETGFLIEEGNFESCQKTFREIDFVNEDIRGFWKA